jgi:hypothetical protein
MKANKESIIQHTWREEMTPEVRGGTKVREQASDT